MSRNSLLETGAISLYKNGLFDINTENVNNTTVKLIEKKTINQREGIVKFILLKR